MRYLRFLGLIFSLILLSVTLNANAANNAELKRSLEQYYNSGMYHKEIIQVVNQAQIYLAQRIALNHKMGNKNKLAIVLDIDETALSNYPFMKKHEFNATKKQFNEHILQANDLAILPTLALYDYALANDVAVFFVTGRKEDLRKATEKNLEYAGYNKWNGIYFKPNDYAKISVEPYKSESRKAIEAKGYDVIFSLGDQQSDLSGGYTDKTFKLPNPFYHIA